MVIISNNVNGVNYVEQLEHATSFSLSAFLTPISFNIFFRFHSVKKKINLVQWIKKRRSLSKVTQPVPAAEPSSPDATADRLSHCLFAGKTDLQVTEKHSKRPDGDVQRGNQPNVGDQMAPPRVSNAAEVAVFHWRNARAGDQRFSPKTV